MNIEDMIWNGASEEEVNAALAEIRAEKTKQEEALRAKQNKRNDKEALKAEGRAYLINALIAYCSAFDILDAEEWDQEDIDKAEAAIKRIEEMVPLYIKLAKMQGEFDKGLGLGGIDPNLFNGLF